MRTVDHRAFVIAWMNSQTRDEIAQTMKMTPTQVSTRASYLRRIGVKLPRFHRGPETSDIASQLNALIQKHGKN